VPHTGYLKAYKLISVAGAIGGGRTQYHVAGFAAFMTQPARPAFLEEAHKRDHRRLGKLDLFSFSDEVGAGMVITTQGALLQHILEAFEKREHMRQGYHMVIGRPCSGRSSGSVPGISYHYRICISPN
jgi:threonyl-tRNA synthetase